MLEITKILDLPLSLCKKVAQSDGRTMRFPFSSAPLWSSFD